MHGLCSNPEDQETLRTESCRSAMSCASAYRCVVHVQEAEGAPKPMVGGVSPAHNPTSRNPGSKVGDKGRLSFPPTLWSVSRHSQKGTGMNLYWPLLTCCLHCGAQCALSA